MSSAQSSAENLAMQRPNKTLILDDLPTNIDGLDFQPYADTLLDIIQTGSTPLTIGVFGTWGSGKTSLMKMVHEGLPSKFTVAWFDAWKYEKEETLWRAFLLSILSALHLSKKLSDDELTKLTVMLYRAFDLEKLGGVTIDLSKLGAKVTQGMVQIGLSFIPGGAALSKLTEELQKTGAENLSETAFDAIQRERTKIHVEQVRFLEQFHQQFTQLVQDRIISQQGRLVVFVDDLDRCLPEKAIEVLESIKLFVDAPGCVFLLGLDQEVIARGIEIKYRELNQTRGEGKTPQFVIDGARYLEKIIQLPFQIPPVERADMDKFVTGLTSQWPHPECPNVFAEGLGDNPRQIKRTVNMFLMLWKLAEKRENKLQGRIKPIRLAKVVSIQTVCPELYSLLKEAPLRLRKLEEYYSAESRLAGEMIEIEIQPVQRDSEKQATQVAVKTEPPPALAAYVSNRAIRRILTMYPADMEDANFTGLPPEELRLYFTLTRSAEAPSPASTESPHQALEPSMVPIMGILQVQNMQALLDKRRQYVLLDAPAGYGKTHLLAEATDRLEEDGYHCVKIDLRMIIPCTPSKVCLNIAERFGFDISAAQSPDIALRGNLIQYAYKFALIVDSIEADQDGSVIKWLYRELAKPLRERRAEDYKIFLSGRYVQKTGNPYQWSEWRSILLKKVSLSSLQIRHIQELLWTRGSKIPASLVRKVAENIARLSGGHPGIVKKLVVYWQEKNYVSDFSPLDSKQIKDAFESCVEDDIYQMLDDFEEDEKELLRVISIFPQMTVALLNKLCQRLEMHIDIHTAWSKIISRGIFVKSALFWMGGVVRQVIARQLEINEKEEYCHLHSIALELWEEELRQLPQSLEYRELIVNALRNLLYHAINGELSPVEIAQRIVANLRLYQTRTGSTDDLLELFKDAEFKEEDLDSDDHCLEYMEIRHKLQPSTDDIRRLLSTDISLLDVLARTLDFLRQNADNILIEHWEKRNLGKATAPTVFKYGKGGEQEIKQSLQALPAIPGRVILSDNRIILLTPQHIQGLQQAMLNAQDSMGRLGAELANLTSAVERATLKQQIDSYKAQFDNATAELAEIYVHIYSPQ